MNRNFDLRVRLGTLAMGLVLTAVSFWSSMPAAAAADLVGVWSGSGSVILANGTKEKARCRAEYVKVAASRYAMSAACATASAKVSQTATLKKTGGSSFSGTFFNPEYGVSGQIRVTVKGKRQSVFLSGDAGRGAFTLTKR